MVEERHKDSRVQGALRILEHQARKIRLPAHDEPSSFIDIPASREEVARALRDVSNPPDFQPFEYAVRDAFDRLLWHLHGYFRLGDETELMAYSRTCLCRVWRVQHFSWWMTGLLHRLESGGFARRRQLAELEQIVTSRAAATVLAENYVGLDF
jgi:hypothetical protein